MIIHTMYLNRLMNINEEICENRLDVDRHSMSDMHMQICYNIRIETEQYLTCPLHAGHRHEHPVCKHGPDFAKMPEEGSARR